MTRSFYLFNLHQYGTCPELKILRSKITFLIKYHFTLGPPYNNDGQLFILRRKMQNNITDYMQEHLYTKK